MDSSVQHQYKLKLKINEKLVNVRIKHGNVVSKVNMILPVDGEHCSVFTSKKIKTVLYNYTCNKTVLCTNNGTRTNECNCA